jgi:hypothetical protein
MKKHNWCWDDPGAKPFGLDKWQHFACYFLFGFFAVGYLRGFFSIVTSSLMVSVAATIIGILWEKFETTEIWARIGESWIGKLLHLGGKATCKSILDIIWNNAGVIFGVLFYALGSAIVRAIDWGM